GDHFMLMDLKEPVLAGQDVTIVVTADDGSTVEFTVVGRSFSGARENYEGDHGDHGGDHEDDHEGDRRCRIGGSDAGLSWPPVRRHWAVPPHWAGGNCSPAMAVPTAGIVRIGVTSGVPPSTSTANGRPVSRHPRRPSRRSWRSTCSTVWTGRR